LESSSPPEISAEQANPPKPALARRLGRIGLISFVFLVVALVGLYRPSSEDSWPLEVASLFERLEAQREQVNVVFIGSSYSGYHILSDVLVEAAAEHGVELRPVQLDLPGLEAFEADAILDQVLAMNLPRLRWIVMEYSSWDPDVIEESFRGSRLTWWQTPERTRSLMAAAWAEASDDDDRDDALPHIARAALQLAKNHSRIGNVSEADRERNQTMIEARRAAYVQGRNALNFVPEYMDDLLEHRERRRENDGWKSVGDSRLRAFEARKFQDQVRRIREAGIEPVYLVPPSLIRKGVRPDATVLDFDDPEAYPDFYEPDNRIDAGHMAESQFEPFSRLVGKTFAERVAAAEEAAGDGAAVDESGTPGAGAETGETGPADA